MESGLFLINFSGAPRKTVSFKEVKLAIASLVNPRITMQSETMLVLFAATGLRIRGTPIGIKQAAAYVRELENKTPHWLN